MTSKLTSDERLVKILSETQATIMEHNSRCVRGSVEVDARLFESLIMELQERRKAAMDSEPVAWDYEWASYIACEGPQDFKRIIEREAPPEWAIEEGQARNIIPLYRHAHPALVVPDALERLRSIVADTKRLPRRKEWIGGQQYSYVLLEEVEAIVDEACRAAMLAAAPQEVK